MAGIRQWVRGALEAAGSRIGSPRIRLVAQVAVIALCLLPIARQSVADWDALGLLAGRLQAPALLVSLAALVLASLFLPTAMVAFTRSAASGIAYRHSALAYFGSQLMKYLPGSFWILPGRVLLLRGLGHDAGLSSAALLFEMTTQVLSGALVAAVGLALAGLASSWYGNAAWLVLAGSAFISLLLLVAPPLAQRVFPSENGIGEAMARLAGVPFAARLGNLLLATLHYAAMWLLMGVSFYALMVAADPRLDLEMLKLAIGVSTLSWLAGFLNPLSPGGIGVREGAIVVLLSPFVTGPQALIVALLSRLLSLAAELGFFAAAWLLLRPAQAAAGAHSPEVVKVAASGN